MVSEACVCDHFCRSIWYDMTGMQNAAVVDVRRLVCHWRMDRQAF